MLASCNQNMQSVNSGETLENSPLPAAASERPLAGAAAAPSAEGGGMEIPPIAKAYFMHAWIEALYSVPQNRNPNPAWTSPLKDPAKDRVWCTDCHVDSDVDFTRIPKTRMPFVDQLENDKEFMVELMTKWVTKLNNPEFPAHLKLKTKVTCVTCHAADPRL